jgi:hypothetical protein
VGEVGRERSCWSRSIAWEREKEGEEPLGRNEERRKRGVGWVRK